MQLAQQTWPRCTPFLMQLEQTAKWQTAHTICSQCVSHQHSITPASMTLRRKRGVYIDQGNDFWDDNPSVNNNESSPSPQRYWKMQVLLFFFFFLYRLTREKCHRYQPTPAQANESGLHLQESSIPGTVVQIDFAGLSALAVYSISAEVQHWKDEEMKPRSLATTHLERRWSSEQAISICTGLYHVLGSFLCERWLCCLRLISRWGARRVLIITMSISPTI